MDCLPPTARRRDSAPASSLLPKAVGPTAGGVLTSHHRMSQVPSAPFKTPPDLPRVLGASQATAIVVGTIIGSGIFLVPTEMMRDTGSSALVYLAWITGGLLSLFGAITYAELGAMLPYAGGEYVFLRGAYGDTPAFLYMWTWFAVAKPASIAAVTSGLARTLGVFPAFHFLTDHIAGTPLLWSQIFAICVTWLITGLNYLGIKKAGDFQLVFTALKAFIRKCRTLKLFKKLLNERAEQVDFRSLGNHRHPHDLRIA